MPAAQMQLEILLPFKVFASKTGVSRIVAETANGSFGLLPHRLDCVAALVPGSWCTRARPRARPGWRSTRACWSRPAAHVSVSVRRALTGTDPARLREAVEQEFLVRDEQEQNVRQVMARLEAGFLRRYARLST